MKYEIKKKPTKKEEPKTSFKSIKPSKSIKYEIKNKPQVKKVEKKEIPKFKNLKTSKPIKLDLIN